MSYRTRAYGEITITPPLTNEEVRGRPGFCVEGGRSECDRAAWLDVHSSRVRTGDGLTFHTVLDAMAIRPSAGSDMDHWNLDTHVEEIVEAFRIAPDGTPRTFAGEIRVRGDDMYDRTPAVWRVVMIDNEVTFERPHLVWPDGTKEEC